MSNETATPLVLQRQVELPNSGKYAIVVSINRPSQLNCFNVGVVQGLSSIFANIADNYHEDLDLAAVIFTGEGSSFCAGADLSNPPNPIIQSSDLPEHLSMNPTYHMKRITVPIVGALKGHVITGGFELALACDILIGDSTTKFRDTHVKFGLAPCWGLSQKLQRRIGPGRAKLISYTAKPIPAALAYQWGLLDDLIDANNESSSTTGVMERAIAVADSIGAQESIMVRRYKRALEEGGAMDLGHGLQRERELGLAHYLQAMEDGHTFENAKEYVTDEKRPRLQSKL